MNTPAAHPRRRPWPVLILLIAVGLLSGCAHDRIEPAMGAGEGAIRGRLVGAGGEPFDATLAGEDGERDLPIELISPASGVVAGTFPRGKDAEFVLSHLPPGQYELSVYRVVPGKRTIAGSRPVTVNPGQVTPVTLNLQVSPLDSAAR